jgi:hypothetical protein
MPYDWVDYYVLLLYDSAAQLAAAVAIFTAGLWAAIP